MKSEASKKKEILLCLF